MTINAREQAIMRPQPHRRKFFKSVFLLYLLFCFIACLCLTEVFVRIRAKQRYGQSSVMDLYIYDDQSGLRIPIPNKEVKGTKTHIKINSLGFRGGEIGVKKGANTVRLAILGASTSFCAEVSNNDYTWPALLGNLLNEQFTDYQFEIVNGGVPGYTISSSLKNLRQRILKLHPDIAS